MSLLRNYSQEIKEHLQRFIDEPVQTVDIFKICRSKKELTTVKVVDIRWTGI
jgi:hypothetical protein